jgi:hypothetical protein
VVACLTIFWRIGPTYLFLLLVCSVHLKLGMAVSDFLTVKNVKVMEVSVERTKPIVLSSSAASGGGGATVA